MNQHSSVHLQYDQLLKALVDTTDLEDEARVHLEACSGCQRQVTRLAQRYHRIGQMARKMAPEPSRAFRVPSHQGSVAKRRFKPALALGMIAAMILMFTIWWPQQYQSVDVPELVATDESDIDDPLMDEIDALVADALPAIYQELASVVESPSTEDLIEWIVPPIEEEGGFDPRVSHQNAIKMLLL